MESSKYSNIILSNGNHWYDHYCGYYKNSCKHVTPSYNSDEDFEVENEHHPSNITQALPTRPAHTVKHGQYRPRGEYNNLNNKSIGRITEISKWQLLKSLSVPTSRLLSNKIAHFIRLLLTICLNKNVFVIL